MADKKGGRSIADAEQRRLTRHEKEQERNRKKAAKDYSRELDKVVKAKKLYGKDSSAYKKAQKKFEEADANLRVAGGDRFGKITLFLSEEEKDATPSAKKRRRQNKEYTTGKDVDTSQQEPKERKNQASGGRVGAADMSAKKVTTPPKKKKKIPQYYKGGGMIKKGKKYAYGGRVAKYKG